MPDAPPGRILPWELGGSTRRRWRAIDSDFLTQGEAGARLSIARLGRESPWPRTDPEAAKCPLLMDETTPAGDPRSRQTKGRHTLTDGAQPVSNGLALVSVCHGVPSLLPRLIGALALPSAPAFRLYVVSEDTQVC